MHTYLLAGHPVKTGGHNLSKIVFYLTMSTKIWHLKILHKSISFTEQPDWWVSSPTYQTNAGPTEQPMKWHEKARDSRTTCRDYPQPMLSTHGTRDHSKDQTLQGKIDGSSITVMIITLNMLNKQDLLYIYSYVHNTINLLQNVVPFNCDLFHYFRSLVPFQP